MGSSFRGLQWRLLITGNFGHFLFSLSTYLGIYLILISWSGLGHPSYTTRFQPSGIGTQSLRRQFINFGPLPHFCSFLFRLLA